jgi:acyl carrier protein
LAEVLAPKLRAEYVAPTNATEAVIAELWAGVLGIDKVGIHDNFFRLGGHSLLATRIVARVRDAFQVTVSLSSLFETPTVAGQACLVETALWARESAPDDAAGGEAGYEEGDL